MVGHPAVDLAGSLVVGVGVLFIPLDIGFGAFADETSARDFLSTLWQVEGAAIALTLTLILVAFEAMWRGRFRGSPQPAPSRFQAMRESKRIAWWATFPSR